jgi:protein-L-isoaspartate(D-aspartate) O-methyltransferase
MTDYEHARRTMVDTQLRPASITDRRLLGIMGRLPRERFVPPALAPLAYIDDTLELKAGRYLSMPAQLARLIQLADIGADDAVMVVGAGTGYAAAVASALGGRVVAVEPEADLAAAAQSNLAGLGITNVTLRIGPMAAGAPGDGPFDVIFIDGKVEATPPALLEQLADGGRLVTVLAEGPAAVAELVVRSGGQVATRRAFNASLPPLALGERAVAFAF